MKLVVGLGNPGQKYAQTRHNIGFIFLDQLQKKLNFPPFILNKKFEAEVSQSSLNKEKILLVKPQNFMNLSGEVIQKIMAFHKITPNDLLVIHDDKDIVCGKYKLANNSSSAGHNGVQNIIDTLGTKEFKRLRVGIKTEECEEENTNSQKIETRDFVLGKLTNAELTKIKEKEIEILEEIKKLILV